MFKLLIQIPPNCHLAGNKHVSVGAHKVVLAAANSVLNDKVSQLNKNQDSVEIGNYSETILNDLTVFLYSASLTVVPVRAGYLLRVFKQLEITSIASQLEPFMWENLDEETCVPYYIAAKDLEIEDLKLAALELILGKFNRVSLFEGFLSLSRSDLIEILSDDRLSTGDNHDNIVFDAVVRWLEGNNIPESDACICQLFDCVRFDFVSHDYLKSKVLCHKYMKRTPQKTYAENAVKYQINNIRLNSCIPKQPRKGLTFSALILCSDDNELLVYKTRDTQKRWQVITALPRWYDMQSSISILPDGIFITGGVYKKSCHFYDTRSKDNMSFPNMVFARGLHGSTYSNGKVFAVGGNNEVFEFLDLDDRVWERYPDLPVVITCPIVAATETHVYVIGGRSKDLKLQNSLYVFDIKQESWLQQQDVPMYCDSSMGGVTVIDGKLQLLLNYKIEEEEEPKPVPPLTPKKGQDKNKDDIKWVHKIEDEKRNNKVETPMCEGRVICYLNDKQKVQDIQLRLFELDTITNFWSEVQGVNLPDETVMSFQPIFYKDQTCILVGRDLKTFNRENSEWKTVHSLPALPKRVNTAKRGLVSPLLCAQFPG